MACGSGDEMQRKQSASGNMASTAASVALTENVKQMTPLADSNGMPGNVTLKFNRLKLGDY